MRKAFPLIFCLIVQSCIAHCLHGTQGCDCSCRDMVYAQNVFCMPCDPVNDCEYALKNGLRGMWMPEDPVLFQPFAADPREIDYSVGLRWNDRVIAKTAIDISYGDTFPIYRFYQIPCHIPGQMQFELQGALWGVFDPFCEETALVNTDYYVGLVTTWRCNTWSARARFYHVSSHLGDEFLLEHPGYDRRNPSAEYVDLFISKYVTPDLRFYGGAGVIVHQDSSFVCKRFYAEGGFEVHFHQLGFVGIRNRVLVNPFFALHLRYSADFRHHVDQTYALGYEIQKLSGLYRRMRAYFEYHDGYSLEGQFCHKPTSYLSFRLSYGY